MQKFGTFLSGMIMPNIPALIAWGILTMFFIPKGFTPNEAVATVVGPMIHYLLPIIIAYTGGHMVYGLRGAVVASIGVMGAIAGSDYLIAQENARLLEAWLATGKAEADFSELGQVHMFIGAMVMAPLSAYSMRWLDKLWENKIKAGLEMLVNMFSAGIWGFVLLIIGFYPIAWLVNGLMSILSSAVNWLVANNLLPLTSIIIEPAKVLFLNNAINHGVLTPLGLAQAGDAAYNNRSILFLLEANPGPGLGLLLAFALVGIGAAKASAPGAAFIQFVGGIHEVYFPYALMKPALILALIGGGMTGVTTNMLLGGALRAPAAPGSILAVLAQTAPGAYFAVILSVVLSATVTFLIAAAILRASRKTDLAAEAAGEDRFASAVSQTEANKGKSSDALDGLLARRRQPQRPPIARSIIVFACDAGMGSSAMGASVLRKKIQAAGFERRDGRQQGDRGPRRCIRRGGLARDQLARDAGESPISVHVAVDNFMSRRGTTRSSTGLATTRTLPSSASRGGSGARARRHRRPAAPHGRCAQREATTTATKRPTSVRSSSSIMLDGTADQGRGRSRRRATCWWPRATSMRVTSIRCTSARSRCRPTWATCWRFRTAPTRRSR